VSTGTRIYTIADLSHLWVLFDAYETDLPWLAVGQSVTFSVQAFPGESFTATISFIDPVVDPHTRTVRVRGELDNPGGRLKPDMFVRGVVGARLDTNGKLVDRQEVAADGNAPLLIPTSAALVTGKRAVVYVEFASDDGPLFEGREVLLGPRAGDFYVVESGLAEGERVVTRGAFKIDAELQIRAKPSLMSPATEPDMTHAPPIQAAAAGGSEAVTDMLKPVYDAYFDVQMALANDDGYAAQMSAERVSQQVMDVDMATFTPAGHEIWMGLSPKLRDAAAELASAADIDGARESFYDLSENVIALHDAFGHAGDSDFYLTYCPMAFGNTGAYWLQTQKVVWNSFYGAAMLRCGKIEKPLPPVPSETE
jgi:Cu(I)/Ag(I) efflux system membrane fusion protein